MDRVQAIKIARTMRAQGKTLQEIADALNAQGYLGPQDGKPLTTQSAWFLSTQAKMRHRRNNNTKKKAKRQKPEEQKPAQKKIAAAIVRSPIAEMTKWDVMRAIENCQDFNPSSRKAILQLIVQEALA